MIAQTQTRGELSSAVEPDIAAVTEEWEDLADRTQATPFVEPGWIAAWWRAFGSGRLEVHVVRRDDRLIGVLPVGLRAGRAASPTNFHTPAFGLVAEDGGAADRLAAAVLDRRPRRLSVGFLDADGADLAALLRGAATARYRRKNFRRISQDRGLAAAVGGVARGGSLDQPPPAHRKDHTAVVRGCASPAINRPTDMAVLRDVRRPRRARPASR